jgi:hypothetical protein
MTGLNYLMIKPHFAGLTSAQLLLAALLVGVVAPGFGQAEEPSGSDTRLRESVKYLSSDELEGRGIGTRGIDLAADYIARQFEQLGLKTQLFDGGPFQKFKMTVSTKLGDKNQLAFVGPAADGKPAERIEMALGEGFNPLAIGGTGQFELPLVFVGYGITAKKLGYDDYADVDVKDKAVLVLRHEPEQDNPHSMFNGREHSEHAPFTRKVSNAYEHGAAAVIFVTDDFDIQKSVGQLRKRWQAAVDELAEANIKFKAIEKPSRDDWHKHREQTEKLLDDIKSFGAQIPPAEDPLLGFDGAGTDGESRNLPVLYCRRSVVDRLFQAALGTSLAAVEEKIDKGPAPHSRPLAGWQITGQTTIEQTQADVKNVVAVLEGAGSKAEETIVIGAHYDHLGRGGSGSADPGSKEIHNGADDNASGAAALIEVARLLAGRPEKLPRRIVFLAFTGEERGLIGSARYVRDPLIPLDKTIAMLNMDMVGRLTDDKLIVFGTGTASELDPLVDQLGKQFGFEVSKKPGGFGPSDHSSFYAKHLPVLHFFTGSHKDYHRPTDDFDKLNISGMRRVAEMVAAAAVAIAENPEPLHFQETELPAAPRGGGDRPYFGSIPDFSQEQEGYAITGVTKDGPADRAGLKGGDAIIRFGDSRIGNLEDFDSALRKFKAGDKVPLVVKRGKEEVKLEVTLDPPR